MKLFRLFLLSLAALTISLNVSANDFEAALSSETAEFTFRSDSSLIGWGGADLAFSVLYNEESDFIGQISLLQMRQASQDNPLTFGVGVKAYLGILDDIDQDVFAFGIGGEVRYTFPGVTPVAIYLRGNFAPKITSFSDTEEVVDYTLGVQIEALPQTVAFIGLRHLEVETDIGDYEVDDDRLHLGVRLTF
jgi:hypothetical protein